jgi:hypothetical protein
VKRLLAVVVGLALALIGSVAVAAWLSTGSTSGSVTAATLAAPTDLSATSTPGTGEVHVTWTGSDGIPAPSGYYVLRTPQGGSPEAACASSESVPVAGTSCTDNGVPVGSVSYVVVAVFHNWHSTSEPSNSVTVAKADQTVTVTSTPVNPILGGTYTLTATGGASGRPIVFGTATPTVCSVTGSTVSFDHAGTCTVTADQDGSTYYNPAPQATQDIAVAKASQTVSFTSTAPTGAVVGGAGYTPTANGGGSGNPVTFSIDSASSGVCSISAGVVTYQHVGTCIVDASQAGTDDYADAGQAQQTVAVGKGSQAVNFASTAPANAKVSGTYTVSATGTASGIPVTVTSATPSVCTISGSTVTFVGAGDCTLDANQAGNDDYLPATTAHQTFNVTKNSQTITFTQPTSPANAGTSASLLASATSGLAVSFSTSSAATICTVSGTTVNYVGAGTCTINAGQSGDATFDPAPTVSKIVTVNVTAAFAISGHSSLPPQNTTTFNGTGGTAGSTVRVYVCSGNQTSCGASSPNLVVNSFFTQPQTATVAADGTWIVTINKLSNGSGLFTAQAFQVSPSLTSPVLRFSTS